MQSIHFKIDKQTKDLIKLWCVKHDTTIKAFMVDAINEKLTQKKEGGSQNE